MQSADRVTPAPASSLFRDTDHKGVDVSILWIVLIVVLVLVLLGFVGRGRF
jgi:flagellar basal body-associated protein FliL